MSRLKATTLSDSGPTRVSRIPAYGLAVALTAVALVVRLPLVATLEGIQPFATFYLSVALSAWWWGTRPAMLSALGGLVAGTFFFLEPRLTFEAENLLPIVVYLFFSTTFIALIRQARKSDSDSRLNVRRVEATEGELQQRRALLDGLAASVLDGILIVSPEGKMIYANDQFQQMWKFPPEVLASNSDTTALQWAETQVTEPQVFREGVARAYSARETAVREELRMKDGRVFDRYGAPVVNKGVHYGWVWTFRDVTERKGAEIKLREGEEHLRRVLDGLFTFVGVLTPEGTLIEVNRAPLEAGGLKASDVLGRKFWETAWWDYSAEVQEQLRTAIDRANQGLASRYDVVIRVAGDARRWIDFQLSPLRDHQGLITYLIPSGIDVTERKQTEQALRDSERHFHQAFADAPIGMVLTDLQGRFIHVNRAYCQLTGYSEAELTRSDMDFRTITAPDDLERNLNSLHQLLAGEIPTFFVEKRYIRKDGNFVWVRVSASLRRDAEGRPFQIIGLADNISDRKAAQEALQESEQRHRQLARVLEAERAKLGAVIDNIPIGIGIGDTNGTTLSLNKAGLEIHGFFSEADMLSKMDQYIRDFELSYLDGRIMPPAQWPAQRALEGDYVKNYELRLRNRSFNVDRVVSYNVAPVRNSDGQTSVIVYVMQDLTEQRRAQEALRESEEHLRTLLKREADTRQTLVLAMEAGHIGTFAWIVGENRHVWSKETEQFFGYAPGEFPGNTESFLERVHPHDREWLRHTLYRRFEKRETAFSSQYRAQHPDGSVAWLSVRGRVDYISPGVPLRVIGVMVDITAMKKSEEALANARNQLASHAANLEVMVTERTAKLTETVHELEAFSYSLSHDMRAPLRAMKGFAQILETEYAALLPPEACGYLKKISLAAGRLDQLIQDVLTYSHILRGHIDLEPIDIDKLARQLIEENPALQPPKAVISILSPCHAVCGHEAYLMQVLSNLVYNAVKFVHPGQLPEVRIWTEIVGSEVHLFVKDNGIGIPKAAHERMFGMFQRYHSDKTYEGTGIGLAIVRKATERMGGQVSLESVPGQGSTFRVQLPKA